MTTEKLKFMKENKLYERAFNWLVKNGFPPKLKGTQYLADLIALGVADSKYSIPPQTKFAPYFKYKYGITFKGFHRRLDHVCTERKGAINRKPSEIYEEGWYELHKQLGEEGHK